MAGARELLRILLEHEGYEVVEASDGTEAIALARATLPDLILLAVDLPAADGYTAIEKMRLDGLLKDRAIMAVTDGLHCVNREQLINAGFSGYIAKPLVLKNLRHQLAEIAALRPEA